ncbi:MAG: H-NS family nucleoid-associated regulatory protein [Thiotrichales bacterium]
MVSEIGFDPDDLSVALEPLSNQQLSRLIDLAQGLLKSRLERERLSALEQIRHLAETYGIDVEIRDEAAKLAKQKSVRKASGVAYRNPDNPTETWGGRGPRPKWLKTALASGRSEQEFVVR